MSIVSWVLDSGLVQTQVKKMIAKAATVAGAALVTLVLAQLSKHGFVVSGDLADQIQSLGPAVAGIVTIVLTALWELRDTKRVAVALDASAQTGEVVKPSQAPAIIAGHAITLPSGVAVIIGKPSPAGQTEAQEESETRALNRAEHESVATNAPQ